MNSPQRKSPMHERNLYRDGYDMAKLAASFPALQAHLIVSQVGTTTIDFSDIHAVTALNQALLAADYGVSEWSLPEGYLCPPVPGRADYLHYTADLLASHNSGYIPNGVGIQVLDVGVGASAIYPIIGRKTYSWSFVGCDVDTVALQSARHIVDQNPFLTEYVQLRLQKNPTHFFKGIVGGEEAFDLVVCNPPFYADEAEAQEASARKWKNLGKSKDMGSTRNFGGNAGELYCEGGELQFIKKMIEESFFFARRCYWFTTMVSKQENIHALRKALARVKPTDVQVIHMSQGQKSSRILAWTFLSHVQQRNWRERKFWAE